MIIPALANQIKRCMKGGKLTVDLLNVRFKKISDPKTCPYDRPATTSSTPSRVNQVLNWLLGGTKLSAAATLAVATSLAALTA